MSLRFRYLLCTFMLTAPSCICSPETINEDEKYIPVPKEDDGCTDCKTKHRAPLCRCSNCEKQREKEQRVLNAAVSGAVVTINAVVNAGLAHQHADQDTQKQIIATTVASIVQSIANIVLASTRGGDDQALLPLKSPTCCATLHTPSYTDLHEITCTARLEELLTKQLSQALQQ